MPEVDYKIERELRELPQPMRTYLGEHIRERLQEVIGAVEGEHKEVAVSVVQVLSIEMRKRFGL